MAAVKVCKFGGTSMANAEAIACVRAVVQSDDKRKYVVVSAPGKRDKKDTKVTDLLITAYKEFNGGKSAKECMEPVKVRFADIIRDLGLKMDIGLHIELIVKELESGTTLDYVASRGEYLAARVFAEYAGLPFVDAADIVRFDEDGTFMADYTQDLARRELLAQKTAVVPGFYGTMPGGKIKTFSRGGSDISGAIVARAVSASVYENWTDVSGFMICDPRIVDNPKKMEMLTYKELRELSYMGANVLHPDAIFPVRKADIPINIRNTFAPKDKGTMIVPTKHYMSKKYQRVEMPITGIAGKRDFISINIEKSMLNSELGVVRKLLTVLEYYNVSFEHMPTGIDTISVIIDKHDMDMSRLPLMIDEIRLAIKPDILDVVDNLALIAVVGHGMISRKGTAAKIFGALASSDINIKMIDQGSSELNIILGVDAADCEKAIATLYDCFFSYYKD